MPDVPVLRGPGGRRLRLAHLTTVDLSLAKLLDTELRVDVASGLETSALSAPGPYVGDVERRGVVHVPLGSLTRAWNPSSDARAARELRRALKSLRLDVLHTHNPKTGVLGRAIGRSLGIPVVVNTCHGLWAQADDPWKRRGPVLAAEVAAARASHAELYQNAEDMATLARWVPKRKQRLVGNGTDLERFRPDSHLREQVRDEWGVRPDDLVVGGVGRLVTEKGIGEFVAAARALSNRATFVWVGPDDPDKPDAWGGDDDAVRFVGARDDMQAVYNALDVFVLPSYREGFSRSGMEAAATGLPMVLSDIRGCREIGRHDVHLLLAPKADVAALTSAIARLVEDAELRARLGAAARQRALTDFDQVGIAAASLQTYAQVAASRGLGWTVDTAEWEQMHG